MIKFTPECVGKKVKIKGYRNRRSHAGEIGVVLREGSVSITGKRMIEVALAGYPDGWGFWPERLDGYNE